MRRVYLLGAVLLVGCAVSVRNAAGIAYLDQHPAAEACILEQGVDPLELKDCMRSREREALRVCSGEKWHEVEICILASKAQDQVIAGLTAPYYQANALGMIGLGNQIMQGPSAVRVYEQR